MGAELTYMVHTSSTGKNLRTYPHHASPIAPPARLYTLTNDTHKPRYRGHFYTRYRPNFMPSYRQNVVRSDTKNPDFNHSLVPGTRYIYIYPPHTHPTSRASSLTDIVSIKYKTKINKSCEIEIEDFGRNSSLQAVRACFDRAY